VKANSTNLHPQPFVQAAPKTILLQCPPDERSSNIEYSVILEDTFRDFFIFIILNIR